MENILKKKQKKQKFTIQTKTMQYLVDKFPATFSCKHFLMTFLKFLTCASKFPEFWLKDSTSINLEAA